MAASKWTTCTPSASSFILPSQPAASHLPQHQPKVSTTTSAKKNTHVFLTCTLRHTTNAYLQLELINASLARPAALAPDALQVRSLCTSALRQFLGLTGTAIPLDILATHGSEAWVRVPRSDLAVFAAALAAWSGEAVPEAGERGQEALCVWRVKGASNYLGALVARAAQPRIWDESERNVLVES